MQAKNGNSSPERGASGQGDEISLRPTISVKTSNLQSDGLRSSTMPLSPQWLFKNTAGGGLEGKQSALVDRDASAPFATDQPYNAADKFSSSIGSDRSDTGGYGKERWKEGPKTTGPLVTSTGFQLPQAGEWRGDQGRDSNIGFREGPPNTHKPPAMRALNLGPSALLAEPQGHEGRRPPPGRWGRDDDREGQRGPRGGGWKDNGYGDDGSSRRDNGPYGKPNGFTNPRWAGPDHNQRGDEQGQGWGRQQGGQYGQHRGDRVHGSPNMRGWYNREEERWNENQNNQYRNGPGGGKWNNDGGADKWADQGRNDHGERRPRGDSQPNWNPRDGPREGGGGRGQPLRPGRIGFTVGRGRGLGGKGAGYISGLGAPLHGVDGPAASSAPPPARNDPSKQYQYTRPQLMDILVEQTAMGRITAPPEIDPNNCPMKWAEGNPDAPLYELLVEAQHGGRGNRNNWNDQKDSEETPEWARDDVAEGSKLLSQSLPKQEESWIKAKVLAEVEAGADDMESSWLNDIADITTRRTERGSSDSMRGFTRGDNKPEAKPMRLSDLEDHIPQPKEDEMDSPSIGGEGLVSQILGMGIEDEKPETRLGGQGGGPDQLLERMQGTSEKIEFITPSGLVRVEAEKLKQDTWLYMDPQGDTQGPFTRAEIIEWMEAGYFPGDLPMRHAGLPPEVGFKALEVLLPQWGVGRDGISVFLPMQQSPMARFMNPPGGGGLPEREGLLSLVTPPASNREANPPFPHSMMQEHPGQFNPTANLLQELMGEPGGMLGNDSQMQQMKPPVSGGPTALNLNHWLDGNRSDMPSMPSMPSMPGGVRSLADIEAETMAAAHLSPGGTNPLQQSQQQQQQQQQQPQVSQGEGPFGGQAPPSPFTVLQGGQQDPRMFGGMGAARPPFPGGQVLTLQEIEAMHQSPQGQGDNQFSDGGPQSMPQQQQQQQGGEQTLRWNMGAGQQIPGLSEVFGSVGGQQGMPQGLEQDTAPASGPNSMMPAGWGNPLMMENRAGPSLKDIQAEEKRQHAIEAEAAAQMKAQQASIEQEQQAKRGGPSPWGGVGAGAVAPEMMTNGNRSLVDIQKEEAAAAAAKQAAAPVPTGAGMPKASKGPAWGGAAQHMNDAMQQQVESASNVQRTQVSDSLPGPQHFGAPLPAASEVESDMSVKESKSARKRRAKNSKNITAEVLPSPPSAADATKAADSGNVAPGGGGQQSLWSNSGNNAKSLKEIQEEQITQSLALAAQAAAHAPQVAGGLGASAWNRGTTGIKPQQLMQNYAQQAQQQQAQQQAPRPPQRPEESNDEGMFWDAPLLSKEGTGPKATAAQLQSAGAAWGAGPQNPPGAPTASETRGPFPGLSWAAQGQRANAAPQKQPTAAPMAGPTHSPNPVDTGFGKQPENAFRQWCQGQVAAITSNTDMTLVDYLISTNPSAAEVQEYLAMYWGESQQIRTFANEFLQRRHHAAAAATSNSQKSARDGAKAANGSNVDNSATKRRGKNKKKVDPSLLGFNVQSDRIMKGEIDHVIE